MPKTKKPSRSKLVKKLDGFMRDALANYIIKRKIINPVINNNIIFEK
jgi:hypothetical protein